MRSRTHFLRCPLSNLMLSVILPDYIRVYPFCIDLQSFRRLVLPNFAQRRLILLHPLTLLHIQRRSLLSFPGLQHFPPLSIFIEANPQRYLVKLALHVFASLDRTHSKALTNKNISNRLFLHSYQGIRLCPWFVVTDT